MSGTGPKPWRDGVEFAVGALPMKRFVRITWDAGRGCWLSDVLTPFAFDAAFRAWMASLPTVPDGLGPGKLWKMGDATSDYFLNLTETNT